MLQVSSSPVAFSYRSHFIEGNIAILSGGKKPFSRFLHWQGAFDSSVPEQHRVCCLHDGEDSRGELRGTLSHELWSRCQNRNNLAYFCNL